ncbi:MAG: hypothetical protein LKG27_05790 [Clostridiaceae bacterium]|jgi:hypothetical protein|nr:hypothetical protein [Clostridiaceae bacterium]
MKINKITPQYLNQTRQEHQEKHNQPSFKGGMDMFTSGLRFLDTNQAVGACAVDLCSMVIPRTTVDFINRGPSAGTETMRREATGTTNHASVGIYGTLAGFAIATGFNNKYGVKAHKIFADNHTINIIAQSWQDSLHSGNSDPLKLHVQNFVDGIKVYNTDNDKVKGYVEIPKEDRNAIVDFLYNDLKNSKSQIISKDAKNTLYTMITGATGGEKNVVLSGTHGQPDAANTLKTLISNFYNITKACSTEKAQEVFKNTTDFAKNDFVNTLKHINLKRSIGGLGIATAIGMSTQPINMYLTKKKTGQDGFVGVKGRKKDNSFNFKVMKAVVGAAFAAGALATITTHPSKFMSKIQFQGMLPTLDQLKLVYGMTIVSRLLVARDKDELRESAVKDSLGFLNLLILGNMVTKGTARIFDKSLINKVNGAGKSFMEKMSGSSLKTRDEVLFSTLKQNGIDLVKADGKALGFKEMMAKVKDLPLETQTELRRKISALNISQVVGYLYSGIVLGVGIPKLNIYMTNKSEKKRQAKLAQEEAQNPKPEQNTVPTQTKDTSKPNFSASVPMLSQENMQFLYQKM